jgi:hypothetical protein
MFLKSCRFAAIAAFLFLSSAHAAPPPTISIQYRVVSLGGNVYRYIYSITNNGSIGAGSPVQLFDILFDTSQYQPGSIQIVSPSTIQLNWSEQLLTAVLGLPTTYDVLALHGGVPAGTTVSGFSVQFTWIGAGTPGAQPFQIFDSGTFQLLQNGTTVIDPASVPAASTWSLLLIGLGLGSTVAYQRRLENRCKLTL